ERVDVPRALEALALVPHREPAGLVVGAVGGARYLAVLALLAAAGHPRLQVVLAVGRAAQVAGRRVDHLVRQAQPLEDLLLDLLDLQVERLALLRGAEGEHLDLRELVDAVKPAGVAPGSAGLGAEAMREPHVALR